MSAGAVRGGLVWCIGFRFRTGDTVREMSTATNDKALYYGAYQE